MSAGGRRLPAVDLSRGLTVAAMIVVNSPGGREAYPWLRHAGWNGMTPTDLIFPAFLFIAGVSLELSRPDAWRALRRGAVLFALGLVYNGFPLMSPRIMNVLQRIGLCYFLGSLLLKGSTRTRLAACALPLVGYWLLMTRVPVPGFGPGVLTPEGNLASYLDRFVFAGRMDHPLYDTEGLLSTIPSVATLLFGMIAGSLLRAGEKRALLGWGAAALAAGLAWAPWFPINKPLWTGSFCLVTAGISFGGLAACQGLVDLGRRWEPLELFGRHALAAYFLSSGGYYALRHLSLRDGLRGVLFDPFLSPRAASLAFAAFYLLACWVLIALLERRRPLARA